MTKSRFLLVMLGLWLGILAAVPAHAQYRRGGYGGQRGGTIGGPHNTYPIDRSAAPCLEDGSFGPNNQFQTPYNGPYGYPGQHPCQFDWASMNRQREDLWYGRTNVVLGVANLGVGILNYKRTGKSIELGKQNLEVSMTNQAMLRDLLARGQPLPSRDIVMQQDQRVDIQDMDEAPRPRRQYYGNRPAPRQQQQSWTYFNCEDFPVTLVDLDTRSEVTLEPKGTSGQQVSRSWDPRRVRAYGPDSRKIILEEARGHRVAVVATE